MTEEDIEKLPEILKDYICTLKRASLDTTNKQYMCESTIKVVNFDKIPNAMQKAEGGKAFLILMMHSIYHLRIDGIL